MSTPFKPGYKQTDVGVIPEEWNAARLADVDHGSSVDGTRHAASKDGSVVHLPAHRHGTGRIASHIHGSSTTCRE